MARSPESDLDVIVVGAGHNGLVAAGYLARAGLNVLVLERRGFVGGACITEELWPGVRAPTCSYICHMLQRTVIDELELRHHGLHIFPQDPHLFCPFPNGRATLVWDSDEQTIESLARLNSHDARAFPAFQQLRRRLARLLLPYFLTPPPTLRCSSGSWSGVSSTSWTSTSSRPKSRPYLSVPGTPAIRPRPAACSRRRICGRTSLPRTRTTGWCAAVWVASPRRWPVPPRRPARLSARTPRWSVSASKRGGRVVLALPAVRKGRP